VYRASSSARSCASLRTVRPLRSPLGLRLLSRRAVADSRRCPSYADPLHVRKKHAPKPQASYKFPPGSASSSSRAPRSHARRRLTQVLLLVLHAQPTTRGSRSRCTSTRARCAPSTPRSLCPSARCRRTSSGPTTPTTRTASRSRSARRSSTSARVGCSTPRRSRGCASCAGCVPSRSSLLSPSSPHRSSLTPRTRSQYSREVLDIAAAAIRPGITTLEIDEIVHAECLKRNSYPSPLNYGLFPRSVCTSINEVICHGASLLSPSLAACRPGGADSSPARSQASPTPDRSRTATSSTSTYLSTTAASTATSTRPVRPLPRRRTSLARSRADLSPFPPVHRPGRQVRLEGAPRRHCVLARVPRRGDPHVQTRRRVPDARREDRGDRDEVRVPEQQDVQRARDQSVRQPESSTAAVVLPQTWRGNLPRRSRSLLTRSSGAQALPRSGAQRLRASSLSSLLPHKQPLTLSATQHYAGNRASGVMKPGQVRSPLVLPVSRSSASLRPVLTSARSADFHDRAHDLRWAAEGRALARQGASRSVPLSPFLLPALCARLTLFSLLPAPSGPQRRSTARRPPSSRRRSSSPRRASRSSPPRRAGLSLSPRAPPRRRRATSRPRRAARSARARARRRRRRRRRPRRRARRVRRRRILRLLLEPRHEIIFSSCCAEGAGNRQRARVAPCAVSARVEARQRERLVPVKESQGMGGPIL